MRHVPTQLLTIIFALPLLSQTTPFKFAKLQRVYVVAVDSVSRNTNATKADLELERYARDEFKKRKTFGLAKTLRDADFVFFVMVDSESSRRDEIGLAILPADYEQAHGNLDALRNAAVWQSDNRFKNVAGEAALAGATAGLSLIFHRPSVIAGLIKEFHGDVLGR